MSEQTGARQDDWRQSAGFGVVFLTYALPLGILIRSTQEDVRLFEAEGCAKDCGRGAGGLPDGRRLGLWLCYTGDRGGHNTLGALHAPISC